LRRLVLKFTGMCERLDVASEPGRRGRRSGGPSAFSAIGTETFKLSKDPQWINLTW